MGVSARFLLEGGWYALRQCGTLLRDAVLLLDAGSHATAAGIAMLAREELGKARILLDFWKEVEAGRDLTLKEVTGSLDDHEEKQRRAQLSMTWRASHGTREGDLLREMMTNPDPESRMAARAELDKIGERKSKRIPSDRHKTRLRAFYVDPDETGSGWNLPGAIPAEKARDLVSDAINDYAGQWDRFRHGARPILERAGHPRLADALDTWPERPELPEPVRPKFP